MCVREREEEHLDAAEGADMRMLQPEGGGREGERKRERELSVCVRENEHLDAAEGAGMRMAHPAEERDRNLCVCEG